MATSKAAQKAVHNYEKRNYDQVSLNLPKGTKNRIRSTSENGEKVSINGYISKAVLDRLERDGK